ncbi:MAG: thiamine phosphate synthase YjbQ [Thermodesulfobacterium sp.]|uniref:Thiamine phosphate synthase YjbQ n=1 Tax=Candidatus Thermodesulfobacterium syntrophicum TaxID=3060442 RepID=A0AAE3P5C7_9BACT|nr:thiamine phosphate synthase YjbQ [Candidatus Thermodesulfobacterium syntrophicum]
MESITIKSRKKVELIDITKEIENLLPPKNGICVVYVPHTTAGIIVNEGADPAVKEDILDIFDKMAPENFSYKHMEGNSPGHVKSSLTGPSLILIVEKGRLILGTWQRVFFAEYDGPRTRKVYIKFIEG